jgi:nitroimidazol reductase NimA-like FMN-containing flavoprotein (pyridoxamine 5'-phosphate oxidase superfamily)
LTELEIRDGHRRLLEVFMDFVPLVPRGELDPSALQGLVAFLRQSVLPFARWEEDKLSPGTDLAEDLAFEHAFLAIEIDALAKSAAHLAAASTSEERLVAEAVTWRRLYRLEGIFELHASKLEDRPLLATAECFARSGDGHRADAAAPRELSPEQISSFLRSRSWGLLSTTESGGAAPYAVPVSFGWDGEAVFLACSPGRKTDNLERFPGACLTVVEASSGALWTSVVVRGSVEWVTGPVDRVRAAGWIHRQRGQTVDPQDLLRFGRARIASLHPVEISGRSRG